MQAYVLTNGRAVRHWLSLPNLSKTGDVCSALRRNPGCPLSWAFSAVPQVSHLSQRNLIPVARPLAVNGKHRGTYWVRPGVPALFGRSTPGARAFSTECAGGPLTAVSDGVRWQYALHICSTRAQCRSLHIHNESLTKDRDTLMDKTFKSVWIGE